MFTTEREMSKLFEKFLKAEFGTSYLKEHQGLFGVPDFVFYVKDKEEVSIISFELKLRDWKRAAKQAFRYKSFSNVSYVVIPERNVNAAINNMDFFEKYKIGLARFSKKNALEILYKPTKSEPYSEHLNQKLIRSVRKSRKKAKNVGSLL